MAYSTKTFSHGETLTHDHMNNIISGIDELKSNDIIKNGLKTINGVSLVGSGDLVLSGNGSTVDTSNYVMRDGVGQVTIKNLDFVTAIALDASKNLINENDPDYLPEYRLSPSTGKPSTDQNVGQWATTGFIPVTIGKTYVFSGTVKTNNSRLNATATSRWYFFDGDKQFLGQDTGGYYFNDGATNRTIENIKISYVRISFPTTSLKEPQLEVGTTNSPYEVYVEPSDNYEYKIPAHYLDLPEVDDSDDEEGAASTLYTPKTINLPKNIHAFVNQPITIFFYNIMDYNENDVYIQVVANGKGKQNKYSWTYTPTKAENFDLKIRIYNHDYVLLNEETFKVKVVDSSVSSKLTVLVIGDSTVNDGTETTTMKNLAVADEYPVTFLGTRSHTDPDAQHEGRGGWSTEMYCKTESTQEGRVVNKFYNPSKEGDSKFDFEYYMNSLGYSDVDCVFIQLGINDLFAAKTDSELATKEEVFFKYMKEMINSIYQYDSTIKIIVNTIIPSDKDEEIFSTFYPLNQMVWRNHHNIYIANNHMLNEQLKEYNDLYVSWYSATIDCDNKMNGDVHPNSEGYTDLGTQMYSVMRALN